MYTRSMHISKLHAVVRDQIFGVDVVTVEDDELSVPHYLAARLGQQRVKVHRRRAARHHYELALLRRRKAPATALQARRAVARARHGAQQHAAQQ